MMGCFDAGNSEQVKPKHTFPISCGNHLLASPSSSFLTCRFDWLPVGLTCSAPQSHIVPCVHIILTIPWPLVVFDFEVLPPIFSPVP